MTVWTVRSISLCAGCLTEITGFVVPWDDVIANSKQLSSQYAIRR
ncbi:hypothetical protein QRX50_19665 [Amycolatopsis carbonis]|uniref:Uncharacterized protein n=1 Tax=Amycolatopsis carbonis TaxID=715471 RepID=A0A9Y2IM30_9PSEU|nr:hypothetical protein [Amycolatopsis sp. 2-15]WIX82835.1 hypothetical protein QRX50_19665 [Amycolatopsis sp. 2-15]